MSLLPFGEENDFFLDTTKSYYKTYQQNNRFFLNITKKKLETNKTITI